MSVASIRKVYNVYASFYDFLFGSIFNPGRSLCTEIVNKAAKQNATVLEIGIGTGLSLPLYRDDLQITGIDISEKMLEKAEEQIVKNKLEERVQLKVMDAAHLEFPDNSFDFIVAMYVAPVVPDIHAFLQELTRVAKPTAQIVFVNHFASEQPVIRFFEKIFARVNELVGFKSDFSVHSILDYKALQLLDSRKTNLFGYWKLLHCRIHKDEASPS
ncbi:phospholipid N-methyltransferase PmtA [Legionella parisiensis]|uniref:Putative methyltransferase YcgJ n=1 Tax=Legionella parisiensis TaxID=45071 RepID=A0A1E5JNQ1_9GAMM|nr:class I SAM-dependent methyltransferase [Legionella parisiensis]KTD42858.1 methyltransferase [Legionella parisiensis]OEH45983.1 putative methyltransferase YcgJ [Legionella parisiensis]STX78068.1 methyltransferase [Legionella parisiensis]